MYLRSMELRTSAGLTVVHPERYIHTLDLLQMVGFGEGRWQQRLFEIVLLQCLDGILLAQLEGQHKIGLQNAAELSRKHRRVSTVWAGCGCSRCVAEQFRTARWAAVGFHVGRVRAPVLAQAGRIPVRAVCGSLLFFRFGRFLSRLRFFPLLCRFRRFCFFFCVERFNFCDIEA